MIRNIYLYGHLEEQFGGQHEYDVESPAEAIRALQANKGDFYDTLREGNYYVIVGDDLDVGKDIPKEELLLQRKDDIHIVPEYHGSGSSKGWYYIIAGVILIAIGIAFPVLAPYTIPMGVALIAGGIAMLLAPSPQVTDYGSQEQADERPSFLFKGPVNLVEQGHPIPLVYGEVIMGSIVVHSGLEAEEIAPGP
jgi:predicted phage tail protein